MKRGRSSFFEPFVTEGGPLRGRPARDHRRTLDGIFWIARTGAPWRDLPEKSGEPEAPGQALRRQPKSLSGILCVGFGYHPLCRDTEPFAE